MMRPAALTCRNVLQTAAILAMGRPAPPQNGSTPTLVLVQAIVTAER
jgi:hypothetical protein